MINAGEILISETAQILDTPAKIHGVCLLGEKTSSDVGEGIWRPLAEQA